MSNLTEHDKINDAIDRLLVSYWSEETTQAIVAAYDEEIAQKAKAVYDDALNCPVDWNDGMNGALRSLANFLDTHYPWLSEGARSTLNHRFMMAWK
jgi:hypothetical protein